MQPTRNNDCTPHEEVMAVPSVQAEAQRHLVRDRGELQKEIGQHRDRIHKRLRTVGCWDVVDGDFRSRLQRFSS